MGFRCRKDFIYSDMSKFGEFVDNKGLLFVLVGAAALVSVYFGGRTLYDLCCKQKEYDTTMATVVNVTEREHVRRSGRRTRRSVERIYTVAYKTASGRTCQSVLQSSSLVMYDRGETLEVVYDPQNPYDVLSPKGVRRFGWLLIGLGVIFIVIIPPSYMAEKRKNGRKVQEEDNEEE